MSIKKLVWPNRGKTRSLIYRNVAEPIVQLEQKITPLRARFGNLVSRTGSGFTVAVALEANTNSEQWVK